MKRILVYISLVVSLLTGAYALLYTAPANQEDSVSQYVSDGAMEDAFSADDSFDEAIGTDEPMVPSNETKTNKPLAYYISRLSSSELSVPVPPPDLKY